MESSSNAIWPSHSPFQGNARHAQVYNNLRCYLSLKLWNLVVPFTFYMNASLRRCINRAPLAISIADCLPSSFQRVRDSCPWLHREKSLVMICPIWSYGRSNNPPMRWCNLTSNSKAWKMKATNTQECALLKITSETHEVLLPDLLFNTSRFIQSLS